MAPRWMSMYLLLASSGFWYQGMCTERIERDRCDARFVEELRNA